MKKLLPFCLALLLMATSLFAGDNVIFYSGRANGMITLLSAPISIGTTTTIISTPTDTSKRIKVFAYSLVSTGTLSVAFRNGAGANLSGLMPMAANGAITEDTDPPAFLFSTSVGTSLDLVYQGSGTVVGRISYWIDDAN